MSNQNENRTCQNCKGKFVIDSEDFNFYEKIHVPPPTFCPECRKVRRFARRNEKSLHYGICGKCKKQMISIFNNDEGVCVYCSPCWWGDDWSGLSYETNFDESKPFLIQLNNLFYKVPLMNLYGLYTTKVNSDYTNMASWLKNCYMITYSDYCENIIYGSFVNYSKDSVDNLIGEKIELCYETINCNQCYKTFFSADCESCTDVWFSKNCTGCDKCFGCVNLRKKSHYIFNEKYSKSGYEEKIKEFFPLLQEIIFTIQKKIEKIKEISPQKYIHGWRNIASSGDYLNDTKNSKNCFVGFNMEDCRFCDFITGKITDTYDFVNFGANSSLMYEVLQGGDQCSNIKMSHFAITNCRDLDYCLFCIGCQDCFGCVGLKKQKYCILNKQYTKEEYFELKQVIINQMDQMPYIDKKGNLYKYGEFLPIEMSPFPYNETTAQEYFPLTEEQALEQGYKWKEKEKRNYEIDIYNKDIPDNIKDVKDDIIGKIIECEHFAKNEHPANCGASCTEAFKIIENELQFYKRMNLPLPHLCPNCRHYQRLKQRNPLKLWHRTCMCDKTNHHNHKGKCDVEFETSYAPDRPEIIYCERCYQQEVY